MDRKVYECRKESAREENDEVKEMRKKKMMKVGKKRKNEGEQEKLEASM